MLAGLALAVVQHPQSRLNIMVKLSELLLQRLHHRGTVLVGALREMIRLRLRLVENITRL